MQSLESHKKQEQKNTKTPSASPEQVSLRSIWFSNVFKIPTTLEEHSPWALLRSGQADQVSLSCPETRLLPGDGRRERRAQQHSSQSCHNSGVTMAKCFRRSPDLWSRRSSNTGGSSQASDSSLALVALEGRRNSHTSTACETAAATLTKVKGETFQYLFPLDADTRRPFQASWTRAAWLPLEGQTHTEDTIKMLIYFQCPNNNILIIWLYLKELCTSKIQLRKLNLHKTSYLHKYTFFFSL